MSLSYFSLGFKNQKVLYVANQMQQWEAQSCKVLDTWSIWAQTKKKERKFLAGLMPLPSNRNPCGDDCCLANVRLLTKSSNAVSAKCARSLLLFKAEMNISD